MKLQLTILSAACLLALSSCDFTKKKIQGNGKIKTENRSIDSLHSIEVSGAKELYVKQDSVTSLRIVTDENLVPYIRTVSDGTTLRIDSDDDVNLRGTQGVKIYVSGPAFSHIEVSGASKVYGETKITNPGKIGLHASGASMIRLEVDAPSIEADLSGASYITLSGTTRTLSADGSGASGFRGFGLLTETATVDMSGASNAEVFASVKLDADASGASRIRYKGN